MLGAPGSGKGTQGKLLAERLGLPKITTGDLIRAAMKDGTPLGLEAKKYYDDGKLVPDSIILGMIKEQLDRPEAKDGGGARGGGRAAGGGAGARGGAGGGAGPPPGGLPAARGAGGARGGAAGAPPAGAHPHPAPRRPGETPWRIA